MRYGRQVAPLDGHLPLGQQNRRADCPVPTRQHSLLQQVLFPVQVSSVSLPHLLGLPAGHTVNVALHVNPH